MCCSPQGHKEADMTEQMNWRRLSLGEIEGIRGNRDRDLRKRSDRDRDLREMSRTQHLWSHYSDTDALSWNKSSKVIWILVPLYSHPQIWSSWDSISYCTAFNTFLLRLTLLERFLLSATRILAVLCLFILVFSLIYLVF